MFSDELLGLEFAHRREVRNMSRNAQGIINEMATDAQRLRRQLAAAQSQNRNLLLERGQRNNEKLMAKMFKH